jgi:hypothetical protein
VNDERLALFLLLGQGAERVIAGLEAVAPSDSLLLSASYDLAPLMPSAAHQAGQAAEAYKLFFVFENYIRKFVIEVLSDEPGKNWWDRLPKDVQDEVTKLEQTEEAKSWMALGSRDKSALLTYPQLLRVMEHNWKESFEELVRDRSLIQSARTVGHLRNTICHMTVISDEEMDRLRQTMRDWFRMVAP